MAAAAVADVAALAADELTTADVEKASLETNDRSDVAAELATEKASLETNARSALKTNARSDVAAELIADEMIAVKVKVKVKENMPNTNKKVNSKLKISLLYPFCTNFLFIDNQTGNSTGGIIV